MKFIISLFILFTLVFNIGCDDWVETTPANCDFYEFCFDNTRDKDVVVYLNDERVMTVNSGELGCFNVEVGKQNVRVEKKQILTLNRVLVDEWVEVEGSTCTTNWIID